MQSHLRVSECCLVAFAMIDAHALTIRYDHLYQILPESPLVEQWLFRVVLGRNMVLLTGCFSCESSCSPVAPDARRFWYRARIQSETRTLLSRVCCTSIRRDSPASVVYCCTECARVHLGRIVRYAVGSRAGFTSVL